MSLNAIKKFWFGERSYRSLIGTILIAGLLLMFLLTLYVQNFQKQFMPLEFLNWTYQLEFLNDAEPEHNDFIVIGDSRSRAGFIPLHNQELRSRNLSLGGGTAIEAYLTLQRYLERHTTDAIVLSIAPYHLSGADVVWQRSAKSGFLSAENISDIYAAAEELNDYAGEENHVSFPVLRYFYYQLPVVYRAELRTAATYPERSGINTSSYRQLAAEKGYAQVLRSAQPGGLSRETRLAEFTPSPLLDLYMRKTIALAKSKGIPVYWYTVPVSTLSCEAIATDYRQAFIAYQRKLVAETSLLQLNESACYAPELFTEPNHLNRAGAKAMTDDLITKLLGRQFSNPGQ